jgi:hypothetical protein
MFSVLTNSISNLLDQADEATKETLSNLEEPSLKSPSKKSLQKSLSSSAFSSDPPSTSSAVNESYSKSVTGQSNSSLGGSAISSSAVSSNQSSSTSISPVNSTDASSIEPHHSQSIDPSSNDPPFQMQAHIDDTGLRSVSQTQSDPLSVSASSTTTPSEQVSLNTIALSSASSAKISELPNPQSLIQKNAESHQSGNKFNEESDSRVDDDEEEEEMIDIKFPSILTSFLSKSNSQASAPENSNSISIASLDQSSESSSTSSNKDISTLKKKLSLMESTLKEKDGEIASLNQV